MKKAVSLLFMVILLGTLTTIQNVHGEDTIAYYLQPMPQWASYAEGAVEDALITWEDANPNLKFTRVSSQENADFIIAWVKDFGGMHAGYALGSQYLEIGLGDSFCDNYWLPYHPDYIKYLVMHEVGHILGFEHSENPDDIMYPTAPPQQYLNEDYELSTAAGYVHFLRLCSGNEVTSYDFDISIDDSHGLDVYFVPSSLEYDKYTVSPTFSYYNNKGCFAQNVIKFRGSCAGISNQGGLLVILPEQLDESLTTIRVNLQEKSSTVTETQRSQEETGSEPIAGEAGPLVGTVTVRTDKSTYAIGDSYQISGKLSEHRKGVRVNLSITDPYGQVVSQLRLVTTDEGRFTTPGGVSPYYISGQYTVSVYDDQGNFLGDTTFVVGNDKNPEYGSEVSSEEIPDYKIKEDFDTFYSKDYGFSIMYPKDWYRNDEPIKDTTSYFTPVTFVTIFYNEKDNWDSYVDVRIFENDPGAKKKGQQYVDYLVDALREDCRIASYDVEGFTCSNHSIIDSTILEIEGKQAYHVVESWTENYPDQTYFRNIRSVTDIPIGNDVWSIDSTTTASEYPKFADQIMTSIKSFKFASASSQQSSQKDSVAPLIMVPSDIVTNQEDSSGTTVTYSVKAVDNQDGLVRVTCTPSSSSYFPLGTTKVTCTAIDSVGNNAAKSFTITVKPQSFIIPSWIKDVASFWCKGEIEDKSFVEALQYLIKNNIILVPETEHGNGSSNKIPAWIKNNACWWSENQISDDDFASGLQFMLKEGIIRV